MVDPVRISCSAVVAVGDELLLGATEDTNTAWLGRFLAELGCPLLLRIGVGDEEGAIAEAALSACGKADVVLVTGGLGPTDDDRSREGISRALGLPLELDPDLLQRLEERFLLRGYDRLPEPNRKQALVLRGARILPNPVGSAPGLLVRKETALLFLLPGVPREMRAVATESVAPILREELGARLRPVRQRLIHTAGVPESALAESLSRELSGEIHPVRIAYLPRLYGVDLRLSLPEGEGGSVASLDLMEARLRACLRAHLVDAPAGDLAAAVGGELRRRGLRLAVAESCTGGLLGRRITDVAGASRYFEGGILAYSDAVKQREIGVEGETLARHGAVSKPVAEAMVTGVASRFATDAGLAVTGVAGPGGGSEEKPVGTVWIAAALSGRVRSRREHFSGRRREIRERSAEAALELLYRLLREDGR